MVNYIPERVCKGRSYFKLLKRLKEMTQHFQGILFDLDGTLIDSYDLIIYSFHYAAKEVLGREDLDNQYAAMIGQPLSTQMWTFTDSEAEHDALVETYRAENMRVHDQMIRKFEGAREALLELKNMGFRLGVVTSKLHWCAQRGVEATDIDDLFEFLVGADDWPESKPEPGPILHGCDLFGLDPASCVYVGDSPFDIRAGNAAGCATVAATWGMFPQQQLEAENPSIICSSIAQLPAALQSAEL